jgi:hypothetical protein
MTLDITIAFQCGICAIDQLEGCIFIPEVSPIITTWSPTEEMKYYLQ